MIVATREKFIYTHGSLSVSKVKGGKALLAIHPHPKREWQRLRTSHHTLRRGCEKLLGM